MVYALMRGLMRVGVTYEGGAAGGRTDWEAVVSEVAGDGFHALILQSHSTECGIQLV
jgi:hypothetical protein